MTATLASLGGWSGLLAAVTRGEDLSAATMEDALGAILSGDVDPVVIGAFAAALRTKGETIEEIVGLVGAMRSHGERVVTDLPVIDTCGTGGDRLGTVNVSTTAAFIAAGAGVPVCKHGGRAASSLAGSADVLEALGVVIDLGPEGVERCLVEAGIGFCFAQRFHPAMRHVAPVRATLGIPTVFNFLGPLSNPAGAKRQVIGVSDPKMAERLIGVLATTGSVHAMVFYGHDGLDELSISAPSTIHELRRHDDGVITHSTRELDPVTLGFEPCTPGALSGGSPIDNAARVRAVLGGEAGPQRDIALLNAAAAIVVAGHAVELSDGLVAAGSSIDSGAATGALERLVAASKAAAEDGLR
jgi:anthranilate phosphoribosyltransferase